MNFIFLIATSLLLLLFLFLTFFTFLALRIFTGKSLRDPTYSPVKGTVFHQLLYFTTLYDHQTTLTLHTPTYRLVAPFHSEIYTADPQNVEHVLKTNFANYTRGDYHFGIMSDIFGQGIFVVDGDMWKQQRKLASFEFSTRVLRDFSCSIFRRNATKLVRVVEQCSGVFDMQVIDRWIN